MGPGKFVQLASRTMLIFLSGITRPGSMGIISAYQNGSTPNERMQSYKKNKRIKKLNKYFHCCPVNILKNRGDNY